MLAGILDGLGCQNPKTLMVKDDANPKGYFESTPIFRLNDEILAAVGSRWDDYTQLQKGWSDLPEMQEFQRRATQIMRDEYGDASKIYLKDPRICRLLPFWRRTLEDMGYRVICLHTHRHPDDVATSLKVRKHGPLDPSLGQLSWLQHVLDAEISTRNLPRIFTSYADILADWRGFIKRAEDTFGYDWLVPDQTTQDSVDILVDQNLQRHKSSINAFLTDEKNPKQFRETLQILESWAHSGENKDDYAKLDDIRHGFEQAALLLQAPVNALLNAQSEVKTLSPLKEISAARKLKIEALRENLQQSKSRAAGLAKEIAIERQKITYKDERIAQLHQDMKQNKVDAEKRLWLETQKRAKLTEALRETHRAFTSSTSWKISAPIRFFGQLVKGRK